MESKRAPTKPLPRLRQFDLNFGNAVTIEPQEPGYSSVATRALQVVPKSACTLSVVSDFDKLAIMHPDWDSFVDSFAPSPCFLMGFLRFYFCLGGKGIHRFAVIMSEGDRLVGLATFQTRDTPIFRKPKLFMFRNVKFLLPDYWTPDFAVQPEHREEFIEGVLNLLFDKLGCQSASLTLPSESPNALVLRKWCEERGIAVQRRLSDDCPQHAVLRVRGTWEEYLASRGRSYLQSYKRSKRSLARAGKWSVISGRVESQAVVDKILEVDRNSWKQELRRRRGAEDDGLLVEVLDYYCHSPGSRFCPLFWLLELDSRPIAFLLATIIGRVAYMFKASYDMRYGHFSPGKVLAMNAFHALFEAKSASRMDFFTLYDYMRPWTSEMPSRETFIIENNRGPFGLFIRLKRSDYAAKVWHALKKVE